MPKRILVIGAGFAGMWSALGAARLLDRAGNADGAIEIALIAPEPVLHVRPRLHEVGPAGMAAPLLPLLGAAGVRFIPGYVERIRTDSQAVDVLGVDGIRFTVSYDRLALAAGSKLSRPELPGLREHAHSIDQLDEASALDEHLSRLAGHPDTAARNTVVVAGGGFTGIEIASELPARLRAVWGPDAEINVIVVEQAADLGPDLGSNPRPVIEEALRALGIHWRVDTTVAAIDAEGLTTSAGERIVTKTVIWTAGLRASALTEQIPAERDRIGRLRVAADLSVPGVDGVFAAGDVALALTDDDGHYALMSCQHAMAMGRIAGHNVAADLIGLDTLPYRQLKYATCLDLGAWGAMYSEGWDRQVKLIGAEAKALKRTINTQWIYPPAADRETALAAADPERLVVA